MIHCAHYGINHAQADDTVYTMCINHAQDDDTLCTLCV